MRTIKKIKMTTINFWIDTATLIVFLSAIWTGLLIHFVLPSGQGRGKWTLWGLNRHDYGTIHFYLSTAMIVLVLVHVWLHWNWVCAVFGKLVGRTEPGKKARAIWGVVLLAVTTGLITLTLFWANTFVVK